MVPREVVAGLGNWELWKHHIRRHQLVERAVVRPPIFVAIQIAKKIWKKIVGIFGGVRINKRRGLASIVGNLCVRIITITKLIVKQSYIGTLTSGSFYREGY